VVLEMQDLTEEHVSDVVILNKYACKINIYRKLNENKSIL
jgi:hypothetical protein